MQVLFRSAIVRFTCGCNPDPVTLELYAHDEGEGKKKVTCPNCSTEYELIFKLAYVDSSLLEDDR